MMNLPANISVSNARLPATYESAKTALANCASIDECQEWANKAEALASYARMADDDTLRKHADRIQARAVRRAGELLKTFSNAGARTDLGGATTQGSAARSAGMSGEQAKTAVRVANVPTDEFEADVESDDPPTVTALAQKGKQTRINIDRPENFQAATKVIGAIRRCVEAFNQYEPEFVLKGVGKSEVVEMREAVRVMDAWLDRFIVNLPR